MVKIRTDSSNGRLGREYQDVYFERTGECWRVHECNSGPSGVEFFGKEDNEWWIDIAPSEHFKFSEYLLKKVINVHLQSLFMQPPNLLMKQSPIVTVIFMELRQQV